MQASSNQGLLPSSQLSPGPSNAELSNTTILHGTSSELQKHFHEARAYDAQNRFALADEHYAEVTETLAQHGARDHEVLFLICVARRAVMLTKLCKFNHALDLSKETWRNMSACPDLGPGHSITRNCCGNLAKIYRQLGRPAEAQRVLEKAFEATKESPLVSITGIWLLSIYADTLLDQGNHSECQIRLRDAVRGSHLFSNGLGPDHVFTLRREAQLASAKLQDDERASDDASSRNRVCAVAERILRRSLASMTKILGSRNTDTYEVARELADALRYQGKTEEAEDILKPVLEAQRQYLHPLHPDTLQTMSSLSMVKLAQGKVDEAQKMLESVLSGQRRLLREEHPETRLTSQKVEALVDFQNCRQKDVFHVDHIDGRSLRELDMGPQDLADKRHASLTRDEPQAVNSEGGLWETPLAAACLAGKKDIVEFLLQHGAEPNAKHGAALRNAARRGFLEIVTLLHNRGANVNEEEPVLGTAIRAALSRGHGEVFGYLLKNGANLDLESNQDVLFGTALQRAVLDGDISITTSLLEKHADPNAQRGYFGSAMELAAKLQRPEVLTLIFKKAKHLDANVLESARRKACLGGQEEVMRCFSEPEAFKIQQESVMAYFDMRHDSN
ncbi:MAG: hypothetical protein Q9162_001373 [Coniocarpon cinnabarinum]